MMPKKIHYCWFGGNPLNEMALKCIESWKKFFPEYEIICWNESNFDVNCCDYTKEAYAAKKWAFVSDYARFAILHEHGGLYFDTDVEIIKPMDDLIAMGAFMGCETSSADGKVPAVAAGLGLGAEPRHELYKEIIEDYEQSHFAKPDGEIDTVNTVVARITKILSAHGLKATNEIQCVCGIYIYPKDYFSPKDVLTHELNITENTRSIHHYDASWAEWYDKRAGKRGVKLRKCFGEGLGNKINVTIYVIQKYGFIGCIKKIFKRK